MSTVSSVASSQSAVRVFHVVLAALWLGMASVSLWWGFEYYTAPLVERPFMEAHETLKPTGIIGHGFGVVGSLFMIVGVAMYSTRKRSKALARVGKLSRWLDVHIFLCTMGPLLVLLHTTFKFGGIVSISAWSMIAVVVSGVFGKYVYAHIPKSVDGQFLAPEVLRAYAARLDRDFGELTGMGPEEIRYTMVRAGLREPRGFAQAIVLALQRDLFARRRRTAVFDAVTQLGVANDVRLQSEDLLVRRINMEIDYAIRRPMTRLFGYWHVFHLPLAIVMFLILIFHVVVVAAFGYLWIF